MNRSNAVPSGLFQPQTLDVDENIFDKNLRIIDGHNESDQTPLFRQLDSRPTLLPEPELPSVTVVPDAGMCVKTKNFEGIKFATTFLLFHNFKKLFSIQARNFSLTFAKFKPFRRQSQYLRRICS